MKLFFVILYMPFYFTLITSKRYFELSFENYTCTAPSKPSIVSHLSCGLSNSYKRRTVNMEYQFTQTVTKWHLNFKIILPRKPIDFVLVNVTNIDGCQYLGKKNQITLLQLIHSNVQRYSNAPLHCLFQKDKLYYIRGFRFDLEKLPFDFESDVKVWYESMVQSKIEITGYLKCHIGLKNDKKMRT